MDDNALIYGPTFYGGEIKCVLGPISIGALDKILDLIEEYEELIEAVDRG